MLQTCLVLRGVFADEITNVLCRNMQGENAGVKKLSDGAECTFEDCESARCAVCRSVREYIVETCEEAEIKKIINKAYGCFSPEDKKSLIKSVKSAIDTEEDIHNKLFVMRRNRIIESISRDYFEEKNEINLEGFLTFRLKSYVKELAELVDYNADSFLMQKEYEEFINLLKSYINLQPHQIEMLHVVVTENREYIFYDKNGNVLTRELEIETEEELGWEYSSDDLLVNVLINKNPAVITLHNRQFMKREVVDTIESLFSGRVEKCNGCVFCRILQ